MRNMVNTYIERFRKERRTQRHLAMVLAALAVVVAGGVFWQLHYTGVAMANETYCGLEEHTHDESCYEAVLICGRDEGEPSEGHTHDASCYETVQVLTCGQEESEEHTHSDACRTFEEVLVCDQDEEAAAEGHTHDASCYEQVLICEIPEHVHTIECLSDETADVETAKDWEETLPELTGVWADDVVAVAQSQIGCTESEKNFRYDEETDTRKGYTRYGAWYGNEYGDWDAMFASFCLYYAGVPESEFPEAAGAYAWVASLNKKELYSDAQEVTPAPGMLVFFDRTEDEEEEGREAQADHVGIVEEVECKSDGTVTRIKVIEGDADDAVEENTYRIDDETLVGYGILPEQPEEAAAGNPEENEDETEAVEDAETEEAETTLSFKGEGYTVTVTAGPEAELPLDTILIASEYDPDDETYQSRLREASDLYGWEDEEAEEESTGENRVRLFHIGLYTGATEDGDGTEVEPAAPVTVTITMSDDEEDEASRVTYMVTHFGDETETIDPETTSDEEGEHLAFELDAFSDIMVIAWTGSTSGKVVLNLGNGNGKYNFADYAGNKNDGTDLRYTTASLADYADDDGNVTINLPSDDDLSVDDQPKSFTVVDAVGDLPNVTVDLDNSTAYDYTLVGWVNIATGEYYDVSGGATTADIDLDNENVFYADWIAATYDHGSSSDADLRDDTVSTAGFVTMHMYDYNELFNLYSESLVQDGSTSEAWTDSGNLYSSLPYGTGERLTSSFIFVNDGTTNQTQSETGGMLTWPNGKTAGNTWPGSGDPPRDATEIWGITSPNSAPMNMLFGQDSSVVGVHYLGVADNLFWINDDGYYTYNSKTSAATYNQSDGRFYVYSGIQDVDGTSFSCFLPYNTYGDTLSVNNGSVNYWFGMDMEVNFYLPDATGTGGNQANGNDMVFNFSGDDDILIFIDDALVLDMSGIHDESFGSINFTDGSVTMGMKTDTAGNIIDGTTTDISLSRGTHDLKVYYMERGGYASNLEIQFNVASLWEYETGDVQTITAEKTWVDAQGNEIDPENLPDVYKENGVEVGLFDVLGPAEDGMIGYTQSGDTYTVTFTDDSGVTRTYVYDNSGETPTLTYTEVSSEGTVNGTNDQVDSKGRVVDKDGYVVAWLDGENLHIRMDKQTLNDANGWSYAWEMLDPDGEYEVLELSESSSYTTSTTRENLTTYRYWSIIGDSEIEKSLENGETLAVILTEAAQEASNTLGDTKDAMGWVIVATESGITTQQVEFSQIAELDELYDELSGQTTYKTTAGVTSQSEIDKLGSGAIWYVVDADAQTGDLAGSMLEDFHLYCVLDDTKYYLVLKGSTLTVTNDVDASGTFCYDSLGELLVVMDGGSTERVEILPDGTIIFGDAELEAARDDVRIYTLQETETSGFTFTAVNTFLPDFTLKKVDGITGTPLADVKFTLQNENNLYYTFDSDLYEIIWKEEAEEEHTVSTGEDGTYLFHYLPDGTYILTEVAAPDGYNLLPAAITITIEDGSVMTVEWASNVNVDIKNYVVASEDGLTITVANQSGAELPNTGGPGTWIYILAGLLLMSTAGYLFLLKKRRGVRA